MAEEITSRIKNLDPNDPEAAERLGGEIRAEALESSATVVGLWSSGDEGYATSAAAVLMELEHLPLLPLIAASGHRRPEIRAGSLSLAVDLQLSLREKLVAALDGLLEDKEVIPEPEIPVAVEEEPIPYRVCDEAYLMLRRLLRFDDDEIVHEQNAGEFLRLTDEEKDAEIQRSRESGTAPRP